jgi:hypothetical protein
MNDLSQQPTVLEACKSFLSSPFSTLYCSKSSVFIHNAQVTHTRDAAPRLQKGLTDDGTNFAVVPVAALDHELAEAAVQQLECRCFPSNSSPRLPLSVQHLASAAACVQQLAAAAACD